MRRPSDSEPDGHAGARRVTVGLGVTRTRYGRARGTVTTAGVRVTVTHCVGSLRAGTQQLDFNPASGPRALRLELANLKLNRSLSSPTPVDALSQPAAVRHGAGGASVSRDRAGLSPVLLPYRLPGCLSATVPTWPCLRTILPMTYDAPITSGAECPESFRIALFHTAPMARVFRNRFVLAPSFMALPIEGKATTFVCHTLQKTGRLA